MIKEIKAICWDLDGVLIDSEDLHTEVDQAALAPYGISVTDSDRKRYLGARVRDFFEAISKERGVTLPLDEIIQEHDQILARYYREVFPAVTNSLEVCKELLKANILQALVTSQKSDVASPALTRLGFEGIFKVRIFGDMVKRGKPHREPYSLAFKQLNVIPSESAVAEDAYNGLVSARDAGSGLLIGKRGRHNPKEDLSLAHFVIEDLREIPPLLERFR